MSIRLGFVAALAFAVASGAQAAPLGVDGVSSAGEYGSATAQVGFLAGTADDFSAFYTTNSQVAYDIYLKSANGYLYGFLNPRPDVGGAVSMGLLFSNLYFDLDPLAGNGSDLGFETGLTGARAFIPGVAGSVVVAGISTAFSTGYEFAIPVDYFTTPIAGLSYYAGQGFPTLGASADVVLRISQSLGYSPVAGAAFGPDRLGRVTLQAVDVPEPATMSVLLAGMMAVAGWRRRSVRKAALA